MSAVAADRAGVVERGDGALSLRDALLLGCGPLLVVVLGLIAAAQ